MLPSRTAVSVVSLNDMGCTINKRVVVYMCILCCYYYNDKCSQGYRELDKRREADMPLHCCTRGIQRRLDSSTCCSRNAIARYIIFIVYLKTTGRTTCSVALVVLTACFETDCIGRSRRTAIVACCFFTTALSNSIRPSIRWCIRYMVLIYNLVF